jgi:hypothetical protein
MKNVVHVLPNLLLLLALEQSVLEEQVLQFFEIPEPPQIGLNISPR